MNTIMKKRVNEYDYTESIYRNRFYKIHFIGSIIWKRVNEFNHLHQTHVQLVHKVERNFQWKYIHIIIFIDSILYNPFVKTISYSRLCKSELMNIKIEFCGNDFLKLILENRFSKLDFGKSIL